MIKELILKIIPARLWWYLQEWMEKDARMEKYFTIISAYGPGVRRYTPNFPQVFGKK